MSKKPTGFHKSKKGEIRPCFAAPGTCKLGEHRETKEELERFYQEQMEKEYFEKISKKIKSVDTQEQKEIEKQKFNSYVELKKEPTKNIELFKYQLENIIDIQNKIKDYETKLNNIYSQYEKKCHKNREKVLMNRKEYCSKCVKFMPHYENLKESLRYRTSIMQTAMGEIDQVQDFVKSTKKSLLQEHYSRKSSSSYLIYNSKDYDKVLNQLKKDGYTYQIRPNLRNNLGENFLIRFSTHNPSEMYDEKHRLKSGNIWDYTEASILVDYKHSNQEIPKIDSLKRALKHRIMNQERKEKPQQPQTQSKNSKLEKMKNKYR